LNVCVQTYFALKLAGVSPQEEWMRRARQYILGRGGLCGINTIVRFWLALFGQIEWSLVPVIPPELILFPTWFPFNIYEFASWSRATIVALMVLSALRPVYSVPVSAELSDLVLEGHPVAPYRFPRGRQYRWERFFLRADRLLQRRERAGWKPGRKRALEKAESWILEHQEEDGSWGGILLPWVYSLIALHSLGYPPDHPVLSRGMEGLESFFVQHQGSSRRHRRSGTRPGPPSPCRSRA
jgi:squalene-hopene/tetraprenyl-beta-curcumene cyclase